MTVSSWPVAAVVAEKTPATKADMVAVQVAVLATYTAIREHRLLPAQVRYLASELAQATTAAAVAAAGMVVVPTAALKPYPPVALAATVTAALAAPAMCGPQQPLLMLLVVIEFPLPIIFRMHKLSQVMSPSPLRMA